MEVQRWFVGRRMPPLWRREPPGHQVPKLQWLSIDDRLRDPAIVPACEQVRMAQVISRFTGSADLRDRRSALMLCCVVSCCVLNLRSVLKFS